MSWPPEISFHTVLFGSSARARLVDVAELHRVAEPQLARVGLLLAGDHPEERRLAGAVRADHADDAGGRQRERRGPRRAAGRRSPSSRPSPRSRRRRGAGPGGMWISTLSSLHALLVGEQLLVRAEPRLRLRVPRLRRPCAPTRARARACAGAPTLLLLDREPRLLLLEPARVVALERDAAAAVELEDPAGDVVEEVPVVRDRDDGALVVGEEALEPEHRLGVEVVRRLVEQQQVGRARAAAGRARRAAARRPRASSTSRSPSGRRSASIAWSSCARAARRRAGRSDPAPSPARRAARRSRRRARRTARRSALKRSSRSRSSRTPSSTFSRTVFVGVELGLLLEQADGRARRELGDAGRRLLVAGHDPQHASTCRRRSARARRSSRRAGTRARCSRAPGARGRRTCRPGTW